MLESSITLVGNLVEDPHLRPVGTGTNLATFRIACTGRRFDKSQEKWVNGPSLFMRVACWRQLAAHVCISVRRGDRVVVLGRVRQRSYEARDGQRRVAYEIEAEAVGVELTWRAVDVRRPPRRSNSPESEGTSSEGTSSEGMSSDGSGGFPGGGFPGVSALGTGEAYQTTGSAPSLDDLAILDDETEDDYIDVDGPDDAGSDGNAADDSTSASDRAAGAAPFTDGVNRLGNVSE